MSEDLLLLRLLAPRAFRGVRFYFWMMFWFSVLLLTSAVVIGILSPEQDQQSKHPRQMQHERPSR